jgi:hypothetical protein
MANWSNPTVTSLYLDVLADLKARDVDAATLFVAAGTNIPTGSIRYERGTNKFQEWNGSAWVDKVLSVAGGGTGSTSAPAALGTMASQNANNVNISGGIINGLTGFSVSADVLPTSNNTRALGSNSLQWNKAYVQTGLKIPVGVNMFLTG